MATKGSMGVRRWTAVVLFLAGAFAVHGCGTDAIDVEGCRMIEEARCRQAPVCGIPLAPPYFTAGSDVDACIRYYDDACLHGLASGDPGPAAVNACVAAIRNDNAQKDGGCSVVKSPQSAAACGWLLPAPPVAIDASNAQPVPDAATDVVAQ